MRSVVAVDGNSKKYESKASLLLDVIPDAARPGHPSRWVVEDVTFPQTQTIWH